MIKKYIFAIFIIFVLITGILGNLLDDAYAKKFVAPPDVPRSEIRDGTFFAEIKSGVRAAVELPEQARQFKEFGNLRAELRPLYVTVDDPANHVVFAGDGNGLEGVGGLLITVPSVGSFLCSSTLLLTGFHVLTAAHCVTDGFGVLIPGTTGDVLFETTSGNVIIDFAKIEVHPSWDGDFFRGNDVAVIELVSIAPGSVPRHDIDRDGSDDLGVPFVKTGYGRSGTGNTGDTISSGVKRQGQNIYDSLADTMIIALGGIPNVDFVPGSVLQYDFDNGLAANDAFGFFFGISELGLGNAEVNSAPGDSGGPTFDGQIITGITSYGVTLNCGAFCTPDVTLSGAFPLLDSSFGEFSGDTSVSAYSSFIDSITGSIDITPPTVFPPPIQSVEATSPSGAVVNYPAPFAIDDVGVTVGPSCSPVSGSTFSVGTTVVNCTAEDAAGNVGFASFTVLVYNVATTPATAGEMFASTGVKGHLPGGIVKLSQIDASQEFVGFVTIPLGDGVSGLAFDSAGKLYGSTVIPGNTPGDLVEIDPDTGAVLSTIGQIQILGVGKKITDLAVQPGTDTLFGITNSRDLVSIDKLNAVTTTIGTLTDVGAIGFAPDGTLYYVPRSGLLLQTIDPSNGSVLTSIDRSEFIELDALGVQSDGTIFVAGTPFFGDGRDVWTMTSGGIMTLVGNADSQIADLDFVPDTTPPVITPPSTQSVESTSQSGAVVNYPAPTATDNIGVTIGPSCSPVSGSTFPVGDTTVNCTAEDAAGNVGFASFTVSVSPFVIPPETDIIIPFGTGVPGCEETNECFIPFTFDTEVGMEVVWFNDGNAAHAIASGNPADGPDGEFSSGLILSGDTFSHTFLSLGVFPYFDLVHPWAQGEVIVLEPPPLFVGIFCERDASEFNQILGTPADDILIGTPLDDLIDGLGGNDSIKGLDGNDCLIGGDGSDKLSGGNGNDYLIGGNGADSMKGGPGDDFMIGGAGNDRMSGGPDNDEIYGGDGDDHLTGRDGNDLLFGDGDNDILSGGDGNDTLDGGSGDDYVLGRTGDDSMFGGVGVDVCVGGSGIDTADISCEIAVTEIIV